LYIKVGAEYIEDGYPEMVWIIGLKNVKEKREKYKGEFDKYLNLIRLKK